MFGARILILSPHPDDEAAGCAEAIFRAKQRDSSVTVLHLTDGCPAREAMWPWARRKHLRAVARRRAEAEAAAALLEVDHVAFLDGPTRSLRHRLVPVFGQICETVAAHGIDMIWAPAYEGGHADHDCANALAAMLTGPFPALRIFEFAEYTNADGHARCHEFADLTGSEITLRLDAEARARKRRVLELYRSERRNLRLIGTDRECFRPLAPHDYARPPHSGPLFYERFHWVPFRHPRIDFTTGAEVSKAIGAFLADRRSSGHAPDTSIA